MAADWGVGRTLDLERGVLERGAGVSAAQVRNQLSRWGDAVGIKVVEAIGARVVGHPVGAGPLRDININNAALVFVCATGG